MPTANSSTSSSASSATSAIAAAAQPSSAVPLSHTHAHAPSAAGGGDNDSAALLWTLRANAVTPSKPPPPAAADVFTTTTTTTAASTSRSSTTLSSTQLSVPKAVGATPPSGRRGPGRPKKSESNSKNAAKWDDTVTALLLKFRFDDMRHEFEGVRNNVEVGECWIQLAQQISRLSGKSFDSHQCQSKLRNLKKSWREMSSSSRVVASVTSPLYPLLSQYLGGESTEAARELPEPRGLDGVSQRNSSGAVDGTERVEQLVLSDNEDGTVIAEEARAGREEADESPDVDASLGAIDADDGAPEADANQSTQVCVSLENPVTSRSRSDSLSSSSSSSSASAPSKRQKTNSVATTSSESADAAVAVTAPATSTTVASAAAPILRGGLQTSDGRIDSSLLSVASGLRTMMEGVIASKEESSEQQAILAELREHNALMKQYCEEVSKQTASLNALIDLLAAKFGNP